MFSRLLSILTIVALFLGSNLQAAAVPFRLEVAAPATLIFTAPRAEMAARMIEAAHILAQREALKQADERKENVLQHENVAAPLKKQGKIRAVPPKAEKINRGSFLTRYHGSQCPVAGCGEDFKNGEIFQDSEKRELTEHLLADHTTDSRLCVCPLQGLYTEGPDKNPHICYPASRSHIRIHLHNTLSCFRFRCPEDDCAYGTMKQYAIKQHLAKQHRWSPKIITAFIARH